MSAAFTRTDAWRKTPETPEEAAAMLATCREDTRRGIPADPAIDPRPDPLLVDFVNQRIAFLKGVVSLGAEAVTWDD